MNFKRTVMTAVAVATLACSGFAQAADNYPSKTITMICTLSLIHI